MWRRVKRAKGDWSELFRDGRGLYSALIIGGIAHARDPDAGDRHHHADRGRRYRRRGLLHLGGDALHDRLDRRRILDRRGLVAVRRPQRLCARRQRACALGTLACARRARHVQPDRGARHPGLGRRPRLGRRHGAHRQPLRCAAQDAHPRDLARHLHLLPSRRSGGRRGLRGDALVARLVLADGAVHDRLRDHRADQDPGAARHRGGARRDTALPVLPPRDARDRRLLPSRPLARSTMSFCDASLPRSLAVVLVAATFRLDREAGNKLFPSHAVSFQSADRALPVDADLARDGADVGDVVPAAAAAGRARRVADLRQFRDDRDLVRLDRRHGHGLGLVGRARALRARLRPAARFHRARQHHPRRDAAAARATHGRGGGAGFRHRHVQRASRRAHAAIAPRRASSAPPRRRSTRCARSAPLSAPPSPAWSRMPRGWAMRPIRSRSAMPSRSVYACCCVPFAIAALCVLRFIRIAVPRERPIAEAVAD